jgi:hypothetical protein
MTDNTPARYVYPADQQDFIDLGSKLNDLGLGAEARGIAAEIQNAASNFALHVTPNLLDRLQRVNRARFADLASYVQAMNGWGPYIRRDQVLMLIQQASLTPLTTN